MERQVEAYLSKLITITKKPPSAGKPASVPTNTSTFTAAEGETVAKPSITSAQSPSTAATNDNTKPKVNQQSTPLTGHSGDHTPASSGSEHDPNESPLAAALRSKKGDLKPTEVSQQCSIFAIEVQLYNLQPENGPCGHSTKIIIISLNTDCGTDSSCCWSGAWPRKHWAWLDQHSRRGGEERVLW